MASARKPHEQALDALDQATSYDAWLAAAEDLDRFEGCDLWRDDESDPLLDTALLREHIATLRKHREAADLFALAGGLQESLYRDLGDISNPELYRHALAGTKRVVEEYLDEVERCIDAIADTDSPTISHAQKIPLLEQAAQTLGRTALMLSGGATMGLFHAGVIKALWQQGLIPRVLSGASTGAIIAATTCTRTDAELAQAFENPGSTDTRVFEALPLKRMLAGDGIMSQENLLRSIRANVRDLTFRQAYELSGRVLNIAISPTRARQKPRLLNHLTAPDVLIPRAVLASSAIPGVFPPASLAARAPDGSEVPYAPGERWIDGTIHSDLPMLRIGRLMNVNHFIVSQTNPHLVPFVRARRGLGVAPALMDLGMSSVQGQWLGLLGAVRRHTRSKAVKRIADSIHGATDQRIMGDIDIHPRLEFWNYRKVFTNASASDFERFIREGERATWPQIAIIRDHTRVSRALERCITRLRSRTKD